MLPFFKRIIRACRPGRRHRDLEILKLLVLSTAHLSEEIGTRLHHHHQVGVHQTRYGWLVWIPNLDDPDDSDPQQMPEELPRIFQLGRDNGCTYVLFDRDAEVTALLPAFDW
ncbi:hypothetical protein AB0A63_31210 [Lentzea sp. NPDC042327]|uniref:DUF5983 family protein n=1 Tax=Lentzea sp. NPDC042327 TaxID=3154801 RepID=UPI0033F1FF20